MGADNSIFCKGATNESAFTREHVVGYLYSTRTSEFVAGTVAYEINAKGAKHLLELSTPVYTVADAITGIVGEKSQFINYVETSGLVNSGVPSHFFYMLL